VRTAHGALFLAPLAKAASQRKRNEQVPRLFTHMAKDKEEQVMLWRAALKTLGRVLRQQPEFEQPHDEPDRMRELLSQLENEHKAKGERE
jgi:hypothetical protein